jgi:hypothetical protein
MTGCTAAPSRTSRWRPSDAPRACAKEPLGSRPRSCRSLGAATRRKDSYFRALFHRLKSRRGPKKAIVAVAASILATAYHLLRDGTVYQDLGMSHFDNMNRDRAAKSLVRRLQALGFEVDVRPAAA